MPEDEIYADFAKIYRKYMVFYRKKVGDYFFVVTEELVEKLGDEFEGEVVGGESRKPRRAYMINDWGFYEVTLAG